MTSTLSYSFLGASAQQSQLIRSFKTFALNLFSQRSQFAHTLGCEFAPARSAQTGVLELLDFSAAQGVWCRFCLGRREPIRLLTPETCFLVAGHGPWSSVSGLCCMIYGPRFSASRGDIFFENWLRLRRAESLWFGSPIAAGTGPAGAAGRARRSSRSCRCELWL